jgi:acyl dehydratase
MAGSETAGNVRVVSGGGGGLTGMVKAALPTVPVVNQLPGVKKTGKDLPDLALRREDLTVERDAVERYAAVCGFPNKDVAPLPYLHMLAFPLHMELMTDAAFPFPAMGTVHLENAITQHRPVAIGEKVSINLQAQNLRLTTKGRAYDMVVAATVDGETVWESTSTYLRVGKGDKENGDKGTAFAAVDASPITWNVPENIGRTYGAVSGDRNPIHLYPLTAKALGFPRHIAHGMWSKARCIAALENRLPDAVKVLVGVNTPIYLPGIVACGAEPNAAGWDFTLVNPKSGAPHLQGRTTSL